MDKEDPSRVSSLVSTLVIPTHYSTALSLLAGGEKSLNTSDLGAFWDADRKVR